MPVIDTEGRPSVAPNGAAGALGFRDWEVDAIAGSAHTSTKLALPDVATSIQTVLPDLTDAPIEQQILDGLRQDATARTTTEAG